MTDTTRPLSPATRAAQALGRIDELTGAVVPAIQPASTFARDEGNAPRQPYLYARDGGPTTRHAEQVLADLDGGADSALFASGMAAVVTLFETLSSGDHVAAPQIMYHGALTWLRRLAQRRGIGLDLYDPTAPDTIAAALIPGRTRILWVETPVNPSWDVVDIAHAARLAQGAGALLAVDCTTAPPCTTQALALGADIVFHSATKYLNGHSDLTAGVLTCARKDALWQEILSLRYNMGNVLGAFDAWLLIRGLRTLYLRWQRSSENALAIARHLAARPELRVLYPGLPDHPGHAIARAQMTGGYGGMLSVILPSRAAAHALCTRTRLFLSATSLGGVESLIEHRILVEGPDSLVPPELVRISVGIEDAGDLIADLEQALDGAGAT